jgi:hypothetical protein
MGNLEQVFDEVLEHSGDTFREMAKVRNDFTVPKYIKAKLSRIVWDSWFGDDRNGENCTMFACQYGVGNVWFFFGFGKNKNKPATEGSDEEIFQFNSLIALEEVEGQDGKWYARRFTKEQLQQVKETVLNRDEQAIRELQLGEVNISSPLDFIRECNN